MLWGKVQGAGGAKPAASITRGVFGGGYTAGVVSTIDYITIATTGNATSFGSLSQARQGLAGCSNTSRGVFGGGSTSLFLNNTVTTLDYITIATTGNATSFGSLSPGRSAIAACADLSRGVFGGGYTSSVVSTIDYITIATTGNATSFGSLSQSRAGMAGCASATRGVFAGGFFFNPSAVQVTTIDYITIATTGNATSFGNLSVGRQDAGACSSDTRGVFAGGYAGSARNEIDYITIATTGNATSFGSLTTSRNGLAGLSNKTRGVFGGVAVDYITIATTGNSTSFGSLSVSRDYMGACAGS